MKKIYPNTEAYLILYDPGAGGNFIRNLIANLFYQNKFNISELGTANSFEYPRNITKESIKKYVESGGKNLANIEFILDPEDETLPLILNSHNHEFNYNSFFKKFPKGKIIFVTSELYDVPRLSVNQFFKIIQQFYNLEQTKVIPNRQNMWRSCKKRFPVLADVPTPIDATKDQLFSVFQNCKSEPIMPKKINQNFIESITIKKENYLVIPFRKLIQEPNWVLEELSILLNKSLNEHSKENYKKYLEMQNKIIQEYAPWILDTGNFT